MVVVGAHTKVASLLPGWQDENACTTSELRGFSGGAYTDEDSNNCSNLGEG